MRVLIVEDNEVYLTLLSQTLMAAGFEVQTARDGEEALSLVLDGDARLVVSDWEMPRLSGPELCRQIRHQDIAGYVYIILVTAHDSPRERVEGLSAGADDFVAKPFDPDELVARVRSGERILSLETRDVAIFAMAKLAESRDPETGAHLERVRGYSRALAQHLAGVSKFATQVDAEFIRLIYQTSPLHDIGKVGIPDSVLLKAGRLSDREFEIMKTHATLGAQTLEAALRMFPGVRFLRMARDIAATHHERYDGAGYPAGLAGQAIPLCGRIVALADVYDAMTSRRVYKAAFGHEVAKSMILQESGSHFDPDIVDAFVKTEPQFAAIRERFSDDSRAAA
ncbi:HD-GYP domain-containing protein [Fontivita pretiosa]|uniref:HD-GYP domain-containing protein n=1 Tax=Fontivita pretiosa TaxID=2989684 RepID=UPI003D16A65F